MGAVARHEATLRCSRLTKVQWRTARKNGVVPQFFSAVSVQFRMEAAQQRSTTVNSNQRGFAF
jgi:hypothetical protein